MSEAVLHWALLAAQVMLGLAFVCCAWRVARGPRAQDRVVGLDALYVNGMLLLLTFGIRSGTDIYFEIAMVIALLGFVSTVALAKFLMRGR
ncbi:K+/H+ antiporter subunit F [Paeniroseomonas aquatica]|uniref:K+/H+ antiporter subunit F n=1 Tax=Paeniroseomonas aquatica TaxID=373043 RepID=UPI00361DEA59